MNQSVHKCTKSIFHLILCFLAASLFLIGCSTGGDGGGDEAAPTLKNVIVLIADGAGFNTYLAAEYYDTGAAGGQPYSSFPTQLAVSTYEYEYLYDYTDDGGDPPAITGYDIVGYYIDGYDPDLFWSDFEYAI